MKQSVVISSSVLALGVMFAPAPGYAEALQIDSLILIGQSGSVEANQTVDAAIVIGGSLSVSGKVRGPAVAIGGNLEIGPDAVVDNGAFAVGGALRIDPSARVRGARTQVAAGNFSDVVSQLSASRTARAAGAHWIGPVIRLVQILSVFVIALLLVFLVPRPVQIVRHTLEEQRSKVALAGLALMLGFMPACLLLGVSLLGIPLIPVAVLALLAAFVLGLAALAVAIGYHLPLIKHPDNIAGAMALGMLLLALAVMIPVLGGLLLLVASFYAAGGVLVSRFGTRRLPPAPRASTPETHAGSDLPASARQH